MVIFVDDNRLLQRLRRKIKIGRAISVQIEYGVPGSRIVILAIGTGLLAAGIIAYLTGVMTVDAVSYACRVQGIPCPEREGATLQLGQIEEFLGAVSIVAGVVLSVLGLRMGVRANRQKSSSA